MYTEQFHERLKQGRKKTMRTQEEVAEILKIPRSTLANYETGRNQPDLETLARLIDLYEINADWLLGTGIIKK